MRNLKTFILAKSPHREMILARLREPDFLVVDEDQEFDHLIVDRLTVSQNKANSVVRSFRRNCPHGVVIELEGGTNAELHTDADVVLSHYIALHLLPTKLQDLRRRRTREYEAALRRRTVADLGLQPRTASVPARSKVLFWGEASSLFSRLEHDFSNHDTDVVATFTSFTAMDYLHDHSFSMLVLDTRGRLDEALALALLVRSTGALYELPVILIVSNDNIAELPAELIKHASDIMPVDDWAAVDVGALVRRIDRHEEPICFRSLAYPATHPSRNSFSEFFLQAHVDNHIASLREGSSRSPILLRVELTSKLSGERLSPRALSQSVSLISSLVRSEDTVALVSDSIVCVLLPDSSIADSKHLSDRFEALFETTLLEDGDVTSKPVAAFADCSALQLRPHHTADAIVSSRVLRTTSVA